MVDNANLSSSSLKLKPRKSADKPKVLQRFIKRDQEAKDNSFSHSSPIEHKSSFAKRSFANKDKPRFKQNDEHDVANKRFVKKANAKIIDLHSVSPGEVGVGLSHKLPILELTEQGALLDGKEHGSLFIPRSQLPKNPQVGDLVRVFIFKDNQRVLATARLPSLQLGMTGNLKVNSIDHGTAYLDLGIPKELVVPISEQKSRFIPGKECTVLVAVDEHGRLFGTQRFNRYIREKAYENEFTEGESVKVVAIARTPLGFKVIVNDKVYGLIFASEQKGELILGKRYDGYVLMVRANGQLDVSLQASGRTGINLAAHDIVQALYFSKGHLHFNDKSDPRIIEDYLHMSKGRFKKAIGHLYKERMIVIKDDGIELTDKGFEYFEQEIKNNTAFISNATPEQEQE